MNHLYGGLKQKFKRKDLKPDLPGDRPPLGNCSCVTLIPYILYICLSSVPVVRP